MDKLNYELPEILYNQLLEFQRENREELENLKYEFEKAKEYGDLSENSTYDNIKNKLSILTDILEKNEQYIDEALVIDIDAINSLGLNMYKPLNFTVIDLSSSERVTTKIKNIVLIPAISIGLKNSIDFNSELGKSLLTLKLNGTVRTMIKGREYLFILDKIGEYSEKLLRC